MNSDDTKPDLSVEITKLILERYPEAAIGDCESLARASADVADVLSGLFYLILNNAPSDNDYVKSVQIILKRAVDGVKIIQDLK